MDPEVGNLSHKKTKDSIKVSPFTFSCYTAPKTDSQTTLTRSNLIDPAYETGTVNQQRFYKPINKDVYMVSPVPQLYTNDEIMSNYFGISIIFFIKQVLLGNGRQSNVIMEYMMAIFNIIFSYKLAFPQKPKIAQISKALNVCERTVARYKKRSTEIIYLGTEKPILSPLMYRCNRDTSLPGEVIDKVIEFVRNHKDVRVSPLWRDVLLIKGDPVPKLLRECPIRELLNDVYAAKIEGISDKMTSKLLSYEKSRLVLKQKIPEMRKASNRHKQMCGCEICITTRTAQIALNKYRGHNLKLLKENYKILDNEIKEFVGTRRSSENTLQKLKDKKDCLQKRVESYEQYCYVNSVVRHEKASDAVKTLYCKEVVIDIRVFLIFPVPLVSAINALATYTMKSSQQR